jgi:hypothetical protein
LIAFSIEVRAFANIGGLNSSVEVLLLKQICRDVRAERCLTLSVSFDFLLISGEDTTHIERDAELSVFF